MSKVSFQPTKHVLDEINLNYYRIWWLIHKSYIFLSNTFYFIPWTKICRILKSVSKKWIAFQRQMVQFYLSFIALGNWYLILLNQKNVQACSQTNLFTHFGLLMALRLKAVKNGRIYDINHLSDLNELFPENRLLSED